MTQKIQDKLSYKLQGQGGRCVTIATQKKKTICEALKHSYMFQCLTNNMQVTIIVCTIELSNWNRKMLIFVNCTKYLPCIYIWFISNPNIKISKYEKVNCVIFKKQVCDYRDFDV
jgi:hypothetical protein